MNNRGREPVGSPATSMRSAAQLLGVALRRMKNPATAPIAVGHEEPGDHTGRAQVARTRSPTAAQFSRERDQGDRAEQDDHQDRAGDQQPVHPPAREDDRAGRADEEAEQQPDEDGEEPLPQRVAEVDRGEQVAAEAPSVRPLLDVGQAS